MIHQQLPGPGGHPNPLPQCKAFSSHDSSPRVVHPIRMQEVPIEQGYNKNLIITKSMRERRNQKYITHYLPENHAGYNR